jgi:hypothetical protein
MGFNICFFIIFSAQRGHRQMDIPRERYHQAARYHHRTAEKINNGADHQMQKLPPPRGRG